MARLLLYRTYHGSAMPVRRSSPASSRGRTTPMPRQPLHLPGEVRARAAAPYPLLNVARPAGAFYLWPHVGGDDERFTRELFARANLTVLPAATSGARARPAIRAPGACGSRWCRRWRSAWRRRSACASFCRRTGWRGGENSRMSDLTSLRSIIDAAYERRAELSAKNVPRELESAVEECMGLLDSGRRGLPSRARAAGWSTNG